MIGTITVECNAKFPNIPLEPLYAYVGSPSSIRIRNVPKKIGKWNITRVYVTAIYPNNSTRSADCVLTGGIWTCTIEGTPISGKSQNGYSVFADGIDENGNAVQGYCLGKGDIEILETDGSLSPDEEKYYVKYCPSVPSSPSAGDLAIVTANSQTLIKIYDGEEWKNQTQVSKTSDLENDSGFVTASTVAASYYNKASVDYMVAHVSNINDENENTIRADRTCQIYDEHSPWTGYIFEYGTIVLAWDASESMWIYIEPETIKATLEYSEEMWRFNIYTWNTDQWESSYFAQYSSSEDETSLFFDENELVRSLYKSDTIATGSDLATKQDTLTTDQISAIDQGVYDLQTKISFTDFTTIYFVSPQYNLTKEVLKQYGILDENYQWIKQPRLVEIGTNVTSFENGLFAGATGLTRFNSTSATTIPAQMFNGCSSLTNLTIPNVQTLGGSNIFNGCTSLTSITLPKSLTAVNRAVFYGNTFQQVIFEGKTLEQVKAMANYSRWGLDESKILTYAFRNYVDTQIAANKIGYTVTVVNHADPSGDGVQGNINVDGLTFAANSNSSGLLIGDIASHLFSVELKGKQFIVIPQQHSADYAVKINGQARNAEVIQLTQDTTVDLYYLYCFLAGTKLTLADRTQKPIEDITYNDELLVWNFDAGKFDKAKPIWINNPDVVDFYWETELSSGKKILTTGQHGHRFFSLDTNTWIYADEIEGHRIYTEDGIETVISSIRHDCPEVRFYNIITDKHINVFANRILAGCSLENGLYPTSGMKFVNDGRAIRTYDEFQDDVPEWWFNGCRYAESNLSHDYLVKYWTDRKHSTMAR